MASTSVTLTNGYTMPLVGLGTWKSGAGEVGAAVTAALEVGYRHFDCARVYENEAEIGQAFAGAFANGIVRRDEIFVTSKLWNTFHRPDLVRESCEKSIKDLQVDYLDLYLIHWPMAFGEGGSLFPKDVTGATIYSDVHPTETWKAMEDLVDAGLVKSIGLSNFNSKQIDEILAIARIKPVVLQVECHPFLNQVRLIEFCRSRDITVTGYSPFCSPDRAWVLDTDPKPLQNHHVITVGQKYGKTAAQVLIRFQIQRGVVCIPKSVNRERLAANLNVFDFSLSDEDMTTLLSLNNGWRACGLSHHRSHPHYSFNEEF